MTQVINKKLIKCCDQCHKYMNGACAWLSLGNEYCDEIMEIQKVIDQLTNNWNELEKWLKEQKKIENAKPPINMLNQQFKNGYYEAMCNILDKMKEIKEKE